MTDDDMVKRLRNYAQIAHAAAAWGFAGEGEVMSRAADRIEQLVATCEALERERDAALAKVDYYEQKDGMGGAVVHAIREMLNAQNIPKAAFIDDHVANAIVQRNMAEARLAECLERNALLEARLAKAVGALREIAADDFADVDGIMAFCSAVLAEIGGEA